MSALRHDASLPWGHWLSLEPRGVGLADHFVDEDGRGWRVFPDIPSDLTEVHLMHSWLTAVGLFADDSRHPLERSLTAEAVSVVRMLDLTRPRHACRARSRRAAIDQISAALWGGDEGEERRAAVEAISIAEAWDVAFLRRAVAGRPAIVLVRRDDGPIPVRTTVWMLRLPDEDVRDGFYDWLCKRLERWPAWGTNAGTYDGPELMQHLLQALAAEAVRATADHAGAARRCASADPRLAGSAGGS